jgi:integrase/recombinase XerD
MNTLTLDQLNRDINEFLIFKHGMGNPYHRGEAALRSFVRYAHHHSRPRRQAIIDFERTLKGWLSRNCDRKAVTIANDLGAVRQLCLHCRRRDPGFYVPEHALAPQTESVFTPHIFSKVEIIQVLAAAERHLGKNIWAGMLHTLLVVLYCTGLRFGEAVRLRLGDVDLEHSVFFIRESKGRSRLVPFGNDLAQVIIAYLEERELILTKHAITEDALFVHLSGQPLTINTASSAVVRLLRQQGLKPAKGREGPRPFDFRHAFAVHRLTAWYQQGVDIQARLPWLSAYMGHVNLLGTEACLRATPELLEFASDRFEHRFKHSRAMQ